MTIWFKQCLPVVKCKVYFCVSSQSVEILIVVVYKFCHKGPHLTFIPVLQIGPSIFPTYLLCTSHRSIYLNLWSLVRCKMQNVCKTSPWTHKMSPYFAWQKLFFPRFLIQLDPCSGRDVIGDHTISPQDPRIQEQVSLFVII